MPRHRFLIAALLGAWAAPAALAQQPEPRQFYTAWQPAPGSNNTMYVAKYHFKTQPNQVGYNMQFVVFRTQNPGEIYYYNSNNEYWCAAPTDPAMAGTWHEFQESQRSPTIGGLRVKLNFNTVPRIPDSTDNVAMLTPPTTGLPLPKKK